MGAFDDDQDDTTTGLLPDVVLPKQGGQQLVIRPLPGTQIDMIPVPYNPLGAGELTPDEEADLEKCEAGIQNLQNAFWIAGKSLATIKQAELHRKRHLSFAAYVEDRWDISESQAHRLVEAWPLGDRIARLGLKPRESQIREIIPVAKDKGMETAVALYDAVADAYGKVTAKILKDVVEALPEGPLASAETARLVGEVKAKQDATPQVHVITTAVDSPIGESTGTSLTDGHPASKGQDAPATATEATPTGDDSEDPQGADAGTGSANGGALGARADGGGATSAPTNPFRVVLTGLRDVERAFVDAQKESATGDPNETGELLAEIQGLATLIAQTAKNLNI